MKNSDKRITLEEEVVSAEEADIIKKHETDLFNRIGAERLTKLQDEKHYPDHVASDRYRKAFFDYCIRLLPKPTHALDMGTGQGTWAVRLAEHADFVTAIDLGEDILKVANRYANKIGSNNVEFLKLDAENTDLNEESYDIIGFFSLLMLLPNPETGLREAYRLLKPGGHIMLETLNGDSLIYKFYYRPRHKRGQSVHARLRFMKYADLSDMLNRSGYEIHHVSSSWSSIDWLVSRGCGLVRRYKILKPFMFVFMAYYRLTFGVGMWLGKRRMLDKFFREYHILARKPL